jgi:hypothetical protein
MAYIDRECKLPRETEKQIKASSFAYLSDFQDVITSTLSTHSKFKSISALIRELYSHPVVLEGNKGVNPEKNVGLKLIMATKYYREMALIQPSSLLARRLLWRRECLMVRSCSRPLAKILWAYHPKVIPFELHSSITNFIS